MVSVMYRRYCRLSAWRVLGGGLILTSVLALALLHPCGLTGRAQAQTDGTASTLDQQLGQISSAVKKQLVAVNKMDESAAGVAASRVASGLASVITDPLTDKQLADILSDLAGQGSICAYESPTSLEVEYATLTWSYQVKYYLKQPALTNAEMLTLQAQIKEIEQAMVDAISSGFRGQPEESEIPFLTKWVRYSVGFSANHALCPILKHPYGASEFAKLKSDISSDIERICSAVNEGSATDERMSRVIMYVQNLDRLRPTDYSDAMPTFSADKMKQMCAERAGIMKAKAAEFDNLPEAEKARVRKEQSQENQNARLQLEKEERKYE